MVFKNMAATIRDAEAPCSVNTALNSDPRIELLSDLFRLTDGYRLWSYFLDITRWDRIQLVPFFIRCGFGFWSLHRFLNRNWLVYQASVKPSHVSFPAMWSTRCRFTFQHASRIFWIWLLLTGINGRYNCLQFPSAVILLNANQSNCRVFFQFQTSVNNHLQVIFVIGQYIVDSSAAACCLQFGIFVYSLCNIVSFCFFQIWTKLQDTYCLVWYPFGSAWVFQLPTTYTIHEILFVRSGILLSQSTRQKEWHPSLRSINQSLYVQRHCLYSSEFASFRRRMSMGLGMFHHRNRSLLTEILHDVDKYILQPWTTNLMFSSPCCGLLGFQHHLLARSFALLTMTVLDDLEDSRVPFGHENSYSMFFMNTSRLLNLVTLIWNLFSSNLLTISHRTWHISQEYAFQCYLFHTDVFMTCLSLSLGFTPPMFRKESWWSVKCLAIFSRMLSCHRPSCRARCAKNNNIPSNNPNFLLVIRFARKPSRFLLSLCGRLCLPLRSFLGDDVRLCHSIVNIDNFLLKYLDLFV